MKFMNDWDGSGLIARIEYDFATPYWAGCPNDAPVVEMQLWCRCGNTDTVQLDKDDPLRDPGRQLQYLRCDKCRAEWKSKG